tara:strand:+ start:323 stop:460 length:138 start_codon:yes stop_codon:yes gene_type:complete
VKDFRGVPGLMGRKPHLGGCGFPYHDGFTRGMSLPKDELREGEEG